MLNFSLQSDVLPVSPLQGGRAGGKGQHRPAGNASRAAASTKPAKLFVVQWARVVLDEGHAIRNPKTRISQACTANFDVLFGCICGQFSTGCSALCHTASHALYNGLPCARAYWTPIGACDPMMSVTVCCVCADCVLCLCVLDADRCPMRIERFTHQAASSTPGRGGS